MEGDKAAAGLCDRTTSELALGTGSWILRGAALGALCGASWCTVLMFPIHNGPTQCPVFWPEDPPESSCPLPQPQPSAMGAVGAIDKGAARHRSGWKALMGCPAHAMDADSHLLHSLPSAAEGPHKFPDVRAAAPGCAFPPPVFAPASQVYFWACHVKQENAVTIEVIIKEWSLWSKRFDLPRVVYKTMKRWLTQAKQQQLSERSSSDSLSLGSPHPLPGLCATQKAV